MTNVESLSPYSLGFRNNNTRSRREIWGEIFYDFETDKFRAEVVSGAEIKLSSPLGVGWIIIGACNLECRHCYGNVEALPKVRLSEEECLQIVERIVEVHVLRVVISGGEPLLHPSLFTVVRKLAENRVGVVIGTNGTYINKDNVHELKVCTRVEVSLDGATAALNNRIRPSRRKDGNAWEETKRAVALCLDTGIKLRVLTALNAWNQWNIPSMAEILADWGVRDWALSWTLPSGRALPIYGELAPEETVIRSGLDQARVKYPEITIRYSNRSNSSGYYCLIFPNGQIGTENAWQGKVSYGSLFEVSISSVWNVTNYNIDQHFEKWVGDRVVERIQKL